MRIATGGWLLLALPILGVESTSVNCTFQSDPDEFLGHQAAMAGSLYRDTSAVSAKLSGLRVTRAISGHDMPRRNFIDVEIFDRLVAEKVLSAPISSDEEFLHRITLDLGGRIPDAAEVRAFSADTNPDKRSGVIDKLLNSPEFVDKWSQWLGDLLQNSSNAPILAARGQISRNAFNNYIRASIADGKTLRDIAYETVAGKGNSNEGFGFSNFVLNGRTNGPIQDTYDMTMVKATSTWLGMGHYDCLVCHDGRRHLDDLSVWGKRTTRFEAYSMSAFFSRVRFAGDQTNGFVVSDAATGTYDLNTNFGNRPNRIAIGTLRNLTPNYKGAVPKDNDWRAAFAENLVRDPMLARNLANRLWKSMFGLALVEPVDSLDPDRLDPSKPLSAAEAGKLAPLQASHPKLLEALAQELVARNYNLREFLRVIAESASYQLSSRYAGDWKLEYVPLFARHYPRRLEGEEVHDAIHKVTGTVTSYTVTGWPDPVTLALRLPEPLEPRSNGTSNAFMNNFYRGNRDTVQRNQSGSILQQLSLMNNVFVTGKTKVAASPVLRRIAAMTDNGALTDELYLTFLSRLPSAAEKKTATAVLATATNATLKNTAVEDLSWALINNIEFLFSY
jgi:Protein of unknown function (DUF1549)/Protein of unknown function (DUF1553)